MRKKVKELEKSTIMASGHRIRYMMMMNFMYSSPKLARISNARRNRRSIE
jgi:hypothetical protein